MRWTLRLGGDRPGLHGRGEGLLQDHRLMGGQLRRQFSRGTGLLSGLISLGRSQTPGSSSIEGIDIQRDRRHNSTAWNVRYHGDRRDARLFHRKEVVMAGTAGCQGGLSCTGLRLLQPGFVDVLVLRRGLRCGGQRGGAGGGRALGG